MSKTAMQHLIDTLELNVLSSQIPWIDKTIKEALDLEKQQIEQSYFDGTQHETNGFGVDPGKYFENLKQETDEL